MKKTLITIGLLTAILVSIYILILTLSTYVIDNPKFITQNNIELPVKDKINK